MKLSVVIPLLNEEPNLKELHRRLCHSLNQFNHSYEVIFVDDGSCDGSLQLLREIKTSDSHIQIIKLKRHYGKSTALSNGFRASKGDFVITMDADLQDDPAEIPNIISKLEEGFDVVSAWRHRRKDRYTKTLGSQFFNKCVSIVSGVKIHDTSSGLKAYRNKVVKSITLSRGMYRFIPILAYYKGFKVCETPVKHLPRFRGHSKYGITKPFSGLYGLIRLIFVLRSMKSHTRLI